MAGLTCEILQMRRSAVAFISPFMSRMHNLPEGEQKCHVLGTFQMTDCELNATYPVFVCEFNDGRVLNLVTELIRFTDTEEGVIK